MEFYIGKEYKELFEEVETYSESVITNHIVSSDGCLLKDDGSNIDKKVMEIIIDSPSEGLNGIKYLKAMIGLIETCKVKAFGKNKGNKHEYILEIHNRYGVIIEMHFLNDREKSKAWTILRSCFY